MSHNLIKLVGTLCQEAQRGCHRAYQNTLFVQKYIFFIISSILFLPVTYSNGKHYANCLKDLLFVNGFLLIFFPGIIRKFFVKLLRDQFRNFHGWFEWLLQNERKKSVFVRSILHYCTLRTLNWQRWSLMHTKNSE